MNVSVFDDIEATAQRKSWIHARDSRAKIVVILCFVVAVVSFSRTSVDAPMPLALFLVWWASVAGISFRWLFKRILVPILLFATFGAANLFFERDPALRVAGFEVTTGVLSWGSMVLRACFSLSALLLLAATTGISSLADGLARMGVPRSFVSTLTLVFRYIFVLADEAQCMNRARVSRSFGKRGLEMRIAAALLGQLMVRSLARSDRIHAAMLARGFSEQKFGTDSSRWSHGDTLFVGLSLIFFVSAHLLSFTEFIGNMILGVVSR